MRNSIAQRVAVRYATEISRQEINVLRIILQTEKRADPDRVRPGVFTMERGLHEGYFKPAQRLVKRGLVRLEEAMEPNAYTGVPQPVTYAYLTQAGRDALESISAPLTDRQKFLLGELLRGAPVNLGKRPWSHIDTVALEMMGLVEREGYEHLKLLPKGEAFAKQHNL